MDQTTQSQSQSQGQPRRITLGLKNMPDFSHLFLLSTTTKTRPESGAFDLLEAILKDAIRCIVYSHAGPIQQKLDLAWMFGRRTSRYNNEIFSFISICTSLNLHPDAVRKHVLEMRGREEEENEKRRSFFRAQYRNGNRNGNKKGEQYNG